MHRHFIAWVASAAALAWTLSALSPVSADPPEIAVIRPEVRTGFSNAGWNLDRYSDLPALKARKTMEVADLKGPGIIRHIHLTRHHPTEPAARGVVLEIWFDDAKEPAVVCPLADFFGHGCNGRGMDFSTPFIECAPWSYNCYFPMPFKSKARVLLRNDTDVKLLNYTYVEWESLPEWDDRLGYFHAAFNRKNFQLTKKTDETFFEVEGEGHLLGRQYSVVTDEPFFKNFMIVMEGNNEVDIDGRPRQVDYLGTEDSFTFSWGFQKTFIGLRAGMTLVKPETPSMLSIYRFHDHQPIRFAKSLRWKINWSHENHVFKNKELQPLWDDAAAKGGCRVDYATVYYWYQSVPGGYRHAPLPPVAERARLMLGSEAKVSEK
ncbi:MAG: DUF2961 domain-containing protein [Pirellulales bacterium]|nr:DUF2961 domain-containing protein [Pirellulales bacterium]